MDIENFREFCLSLPQTTEETPFDDVTLVYKVCGKMFALTTIGEYDGGINLKCDPAKAIELRERYPEDIFPGYHMNKAHWNTVLPEGNLPEAMIRDMTLDSFRLVVAGLPKKMRDGIKIP